MLIILCILLGGRVDLDFQLGDRQFVSSRYFIFLNLKKCHKKAYPFLLELNAYLSQ